MKTTRARIVLAAVIVLGLAATSIAIADNGGHGKSQEKQKDPQFTAHLIGYNEVPSLNSPAHADLQLTVGNGQLTWTLTYADFVNQPSVAHVHVGQPGVSGGVSFFFCGGPKPPCPSSASGPVTISGTVLPADILGPTAQGFAAGDLNSVVKAIEAGFTYANMHTGPFPAGEIRGQLVAQHGHDDNQGDDDDD
jgi:hypothetical protein